MAEIVILNNAHNTAFVKVVSEGDGEVELPLSDLCNESQVVSAERPVTVTIRNVQWSGEPNAMLKVKRGGKRIMSLKAEPSGVLMFDGQQFCSENHMADQGFVFEFVGGAPMEAWFVLRKHGYVSKSGEYATYGGYESETRVGAVVDISGSPDYGKTP